MKPQTTRKIREMQEFCLSSGVSDLLTIRYNIQGLLNAIPVLDIPAKTSADMEDMYRRYRGEDAAEAYSEPWTTTGAMSHRAEGREAPDPLLKPSAEPSVHGDLEPSATVERTRFGSGKEDPVSPLSSGSAEGMYHPPRSSSDSSGVHSDASRVLHSAARDTQVLLTQTQSPEQPYDRVLLHPLPGGSFTPRLQVSRVETAPFRTRHEDLPASVEPSVTRDVWAPRVGKADLYEADMSAMESKAFHGAVAFDAGAFSHRDREDAPVSEENQQVTSRLAVTEAGRHRTKLDDKGEVVPAQFSRFLEKLVLGILQNRKDMLPYTQEIDVESIKEELDILRSTPHTRRDEDMGRTHGALDV